MHSEIRIKQQKLKAHDKNMCQMEHFMQWLAGVITSNYNYSTNQHNICDFHMFSIYLDFS